MLWLLYIAYVENNSIKGQWGYWIMDSTIRMQSLGFSASCTEESFMKDLKGIVCLIFNFITEYKHSTQMGKKGAPIGIFVSI